MATTVLEELQENKKTPCVSIIIPTHKKSLERTTDRLELNAAVEKAKTLLISKYGTNGNGSLEVLERLGTITTNVDYAHNDLGLGFFISPNFEKIIKFPFQVEEKIIVGDRFEIRDILYLSEYLMEYYLLSINEQGATFFKGSGENIEEIKDINFPIKYEDDYEYMHTSIGSSNGYALKSTEKDKSIIEETRLITHLKNTDKKLAEYLGKDIPLLIAGATKEISYFMNATTHKKYISGKISGSYDHYNRQQLVFHAFEQIKKYQEKEEENVLSRLNIATGKRLVAIGVQEVWAAAKDGKGLVLLVEKDYACPGFINSYTLDLLKHPIGKKHKIITDAIDHIMEMVLEKNGKVIIMNNGKLKNYDGVALIERYS